VVMAPAGGGVADLAAGAGALALAVVAILAAVVPREIGDVDTFGSNFEAPLAAR
jgi:predicted RNA methylase